LEDGGVDGKILSWIFRKWDVGVWAGPRCMILILNVITFFFIRLQMEIILFYTTDYTAYVKCICIQRT